MVDHLISGRYRYKINIKKSVVFLYTSNERVRRMLAKVFSLKSYKKSFINLTKGERLISQSYKNNNKEII